MDTHSSYRGMDALIRGGWMDVLIRGGWMNALCRVVG